MNKLLFLLWVVSLSSFANEYKVTQIIENQKVSIKSISSEIIVSKGERFKFEALIDDHNLDINHIALSYVFYTALNYKNLNNSEEKLIEGIDQINNDWSILKWNQGVIDSCMYLQKTDCLEDYFKSGLNKELSLRAAMYLYGLSNDWQEQYWILKEALKIDPNDKEVLFEAQKLSLSTTLAYTHFLIKEMEKNYIWLDLGMDTMIDGEFEVSEGLSEFFFNTYYSVALALVPGYEESVVEEFKRQYNEVLRVQSKLHIVLENHIKSDGKYWITDAQAKTIKDKFKWGSLDEHPIFKHIRENGIIPIENSQDDTPGLASYKALGFRDRDGYYARDFVKKSWRSSLTGELNILNVVLFVYGPGVIKAAGSTRIGMKLITKLKLDRLITVAKSLPKPFDGLSIIVLMEFADGHAFKFIYSGYLTFRDRNPPAAQLELDIY